MGYDLSTEARYGIVCINSRGSCKVRVMWGKVKSIGLRDVSGMVWLGVMELITFMCVHGDK